MLELVTRLDAWLSRYRPSYHAQLLPGLTAEELTAFEAQLGVTLPDGFRVFYQWRNGQADDYFKSFRGNQSWMSAADIAGTKELMDSMIGSDFEPGWWERSWIPFLHNGAGSYLCVDIAGMNGGQPGQLVEFWNRDRDRPVVSPGLDYWLHDFVRSLERDRWEETSLGFECVEVRDESS
jgi:cell wall assembly regulator SMI1